MALSLSLIIALFTIVHFVVVADHLPDNPSPFGPCTSIEGRLVDKATGEGIPNVAVTGVAMNTQSLLQGYSTSHSEGDGTFDLEVLNGQWNVTFTHDDYAPVSKEVSVPNCDTVVLLGDVGMESVEAEPTGSVTVVLEERVSSQEPQFAPLTVQTITAAVGGDQCIPETGETAQTNNTGVASFDGLINGVEYCFVFEAAGYETAQENVDVTAAGAGVTLNTHRVLQPVTGTIIDAFTGDAPDKGLEARAFHPVYCINGEPVIDDGPGGFSCSGNFTGGSFTLNLPWHEDEDYEIVVSNPTYYLPESTEASVSKPEEEDPAASLQENLDEVIEDVDPDPPSGDEPEPLMLVRTTGDLTGTVTNGTAAVEEAEVCLRHTFLVCTVTDETGDYTLRASWFDGYRLTVTHDDHLDHGPEDGIELDPTSPLTKNLVLQVGGMGWVTGSLCDKLLLGDEQEPCIADTSSTTVKLVYEGDNNIEFTGNVQTDGSFTITADTGTYTLQVIDPRYTTYDHDDLINVEEDKGRAIEDPIELDRITLDLHVTVQEDADPIEGAVVTVSNSTLLGSPRAETTSSNGVATFDDLPWGDYEVAFPQSTIDGIRYETNTTTITIGHTDTSPVQAPLDVKAPMASINGTVRDADDASAALQGVAVFMDGHATLDSGRYTLDVETDANGDYTLVVPAVGSVEIHYEHDDYESEDTDFSGIAQDETEADVDLSRLTWDDVTITVKDVATGEGIEDATVRLQRGTSEIIPEEGDDGDYEFEDVPWGTYDVTVTHGDYHSPTDAITLPVPSPASGGDPPSLTVELTRKDGTLIGTIEEEGGGTIANRGGFTVNCGDHSLTDFTTDADGKFSFTLPVGEYDCTVTDGREEFYPSPAIEITIGVEGSSGSFNLERREWTISGRVVDPTNDNQGVPDATVSAITVDFEGETSTSSSSMLTDSDGWFEINVTYNREATDEGFQFNQVLLWTTPPGHHPGANATMIGPDSGNTHPIEGVEIQVLPENPSLPLATLQGTVVDDDAIEEIGVAGADVTAKLQGEPCSLPGGQEIDTFRTATDALGNFVLPVACPGEYEVTVSHLFYYDIDQQMSATPIDDTIGNLGVEPGTIEMHRIESNASVTVYSQTGSFLSRTNVMIDGLDVKKTDAEITGAENSKRGIAHFASIPWGIYNVTVATGDAYATEMEGDSVLVVYPHIGGTSVAVAFSDPID